MKRYLFFAFEDYEASGGWADLVQSYDDLRDACTDARRRLEERGSANNVQVIDTSTGKISYLYRSELVRDGESLGYRTYESSGDTLVQAMAGAHEQEELAKHNLPPPPPYPWVTWCLACDAKRNILAEPPVPQKLLCASCRTPLYDDTFWRDFPEDHPLYEDNASSLRILAGVLVRDRLTDKLVALPKGWRQASHPRYEQAVMREDGVGVGYEGTAYEVFGPNSAGGKLPSLEAALKEAGP